MLSVYSPILRAFCEIDDEAADVRYNIQAVVKQLIYKIKVTEHNPRTIISSHTLVSWQAKLIANLSFIELCHMTKDTLTRKISSINRSLEDPETELLESTIHHLLSSRETYQYFLHL